jgi:serine protease Do
MTPRTFVRNQLFGALLGAAAVAAPVGALYALGAGPGAGPATAQVAPTVPAPATGNPNAVLPDFSTMVQRYGPAVVNISVVSKVPASYSPDGQDSDDDDDSGPQSGPQGQNPFGPGQNPFGQFFRGLPMQPQQQQPMHGEGSGFIVSSDGTILTNAHVVSGASEVTVRLTDRREYIAKVIGVDTKSDVAVIRIAAKNLPTVKMGDTHNLKVGEWVVAIGAPFGFENSVTAGIVSAKGRMLPDSGYVPFIQTDVPINPGNSGGPLFNMRGEVVGINSQIYTRSGGYQGVSFSIPIDVAMGVSTQLQTHGHVTRGKLGVVIQNVDQGLADSFGLPQPEGDPQVEWRAGEPVNRVTRRRRRPCARNDCETRAVEKPRQPRSERQARRDGRQADGLQCRPPAGRRQAGPRGPTADEPGAAPGQHAGRLARGAGEGPGR